MSWTDRPTGAVPRDAGAADALLLDAARRIAHRAYAPYSGFRVGAAALADDGRVVTGCNVENAGYGVTLCAECGLVSDLVASGGGRLIRFVCVGTAQADTSAAPVVMPCGRCRQLLSEHAAPGLTILTPKGPLPMSAVLPQAFGPADLEVAAEVAEPRPDTHPGQPGEANQEGQR